MERKTYPVTLRKPNPLNGGIYWIPITPGETMVFIVFTMHLSLALLIPWHVSTFPFIVFKSCWPAVCEQNLLDTGNEILLEANDEKRGENSLCEIQ